METNLYLGCDISKDSFTYCLRDTSQILHQGEVVNTVTDIRKWLKALKQEHRVNLNQVIFCMEHTGVYGLILMRTLHAASLRICVESAAHIKLSLGMQRGKNDKVDAQRIAEYARRYTDKLKQWRPKRAIVEKLNLLNRQRARLLKVRNILSNSLGEVKRFVGKNEHTMLKKSAQASFKGITEDLKRLDKQIEELIKSDENLNRLNRFITSVRGIGIVTSSAVLVRTNEFQDYTEANKFSCTAGLAPFEHSSGKSIRGKSRVSHRAHKDIKTLFHMCAIGCIGRKGDLKDFYDRKLGEGKNKMLVINAIRNKLVHRIFAVVRDQVMYDKNYKYRLSMS
jgi:transposase